MPDDGYPAAVSGDGSIILGHSSFETGREPWIWDAEHGMRSLQTALGQEYDLDLNGWRLIHVSDISADGSVIVGWALGETGPAAGFVVTLPEPAGGVLALASAALFGRRRRGSSAGSRAGFPRN
jgi:hypothetical protein